MSSWRSECIDNLEDILHGIPWNTRTPYVLMWGSGAHPISDFGRADCFNSFEGRRTRCSTVIRCAAVGMEAAGGWVGFGFGAPHSTSDPLRQDQNKCRCAGMPTVRRPVRNGRR